MNLFAYPKRIFYDYGSRVAIFLVERRLKKRPKDAGTWIVLARLYEVRNAVPEAIRVLQRAIRIFPNNPALQQHLQRLRSEQTK